MDMVGNAGFRKALVDAAKRVYDPNEFMIQKRNTFSPNKTFKEPKLPKMDPQNSCQDRRLTDALCCVIRSSALNLAEVNRVALLFPESEENDTKRARNLFRRLFLASRADWRPILTLIPTLIQDYKKPIVATDRHSTVPIFSQDLWNRLEQSIKHFKDDTASAKLTAAGVIDRANSLALLLFLLLALSTAGSDSIVLWVITERRELEIDGFVDGVTGWIGDVSHSNDRSDPEYHLFCRQNKDDLNNLFHQLQDTLLQHTSKSMNEQWAHKMFALAMNVRKSIVVVRMEGPLRSGLELGFGLHTARMHATFDDSFFASYIQDHSVKCPSSSMPAYIQGILKRPFDHLQ